MLIQEIRVGTGVGIFFKRCNGNIMPTGGVRRRPPIISRTSISENYAKTCTNKTIYQKYTPFPSNPRHLQMSRWDIRRDILYGMHGRWNNRSLVIYCIETHPRSVKGIQISNPPSDAKPATPTRSCLAFTTPRFSKGCTPIHPVILHLSLWSFPWYRQKQGAGSGRTQYTHPWVYRKLRPIAPSHHLALSTKSQSIRWLQSGKKMPKESMLSSPETLLSQLSESSSSGWT